MKSRKNNIRLKIILSLVFGVFLFGGIAVLAYLSQNDIDNRNRAAELNNTIIKDQFLNRESIYIEIQSTIYGLDPILYNKRGEVVQKYGVIYPNKSGLYTFNSGILKPSDSGYYVHFVPHCEGRVCITEPTFTSQERLVQEPNADIFFSDDAYCDTGKVSFYTQNSTRDWLQYTITSKSGSVYPIDPPVLPIDNIDTDIEEFNNNSNASLSGRSYVIQQDLSQCAGAKKCPVEVSELIEGTDYSVKVAYCQTKWSDCVDLGYLTLKTRSCKQLDIAFSNYNIPSKVYKSENFTIQANIINKSSFSSVPIKLSVSVLKKSCSENCNVFQKSYNIPEIKPQAISETTIPIKIDNLGKYSVTLLAEADNSRDMVSNPIYAYGDIEIIDRPISCNLTCPNNQIPNSDCTSCVCNLSCNSPLTPNNSCTSCICNKTCPTNFAPSSDCTKCNCSLQCDANFKVSSDCKKCVCKTTCSTGYKQNSDCSCTKIVAPIEDDDDSNQYSYTPTSSQDTATTSEDTSNADSDNSGSTSTNDKEEGKGVDIVPLLIIPLVVLLILGLLLIPFLVKKKGPSWN